MGWGESNTYYNSVLILTLSCQVAELSERLSAIMTKRSRKLSSSGWRDRPKISILVEWTVCQKNVANTLNTVEIILKNKVQFVTFPFFYMVELQNFLNAPRTYFWAYFDDRCFSWPFRKKKERQRMDMFLSWKIDCNDLIVKDRTGGSVAVSSDYCQWMHYIVYRTC